MENSDGEVMHITWNEFKAYFDDYCQEDVRFDKFYGHKFNKDKK